MLDNGASPFADVLEQTAGPVEFEDPNTGKRYIGDYVRLNKTLLMFIQAAFDADENKVTPTNWIQGELF